MVPSFTTCLWSQSGSNSRFASWLTVCLTGAVVNIHNKSLSLIWNPRIVKFNPNLSVYYSSCFPNMYLFLFTYYLSLPRNIFLDDELRLLFDQVQNSLTKNLSLLEPPGRDADVISHLSSSRSSDAGSFAVLLLDDTHMKCHKNLMYIREKESEVMNLSWASGAIRCVGRGPSLCASQQSLLVFPNTRFPENPAAVSNIRTRASWPSALFVTICDVCFVTECLGRPCCSHPDPVMHFATMRPCVHTLKKKEKRAIHKVGGHLKWTCSKIHTRNQSRLSSGNWIMYALPLKCMFVNNNGGETGSAKCAACRRVWLFVYLFSWLLPPREWRRRQHKRRHGSERLCHCCLKTAMAAVFAAVNDAGPAASLEIFPIHHLHLHPDPHWALLWTIPLPSCFCRPFSFVDLSENDPSLLEDLHFYLLYIWNLSKIQGCCWVMKL